MYGVPVTTPSFAAAAAAADAAVGNDIETDVTGVPVRVLVILLVYKYNVCYIGEQKVNIL